MATSRGATISTFTATATTTTVSDAHTVDTSTTLLVLCISLQAGETVTVAPTWNGGAETLVLMGETKRSGSNNDQSIAVYALINPTVKTDNIAYTVSATTTVAHTAVNYLGTLTGSEQEAFYLMESVVNDAASSTTVFASAGIAGQSLFVCGSAKGNDTVPASNASSFAELADVSTGGSNTADQGHYVADDIGGGISACTITWGSSDENAGLMFLIRDAFRSMDLGDYELPQGTADAGPARVGAGGHCRPGPYVVGSYIYLMGRDSLLTASINIWRCALTADPTLDASWVPQEGSPTRINGQFIASFAMIVDGTDLHCVFQTGLDPAVQTLSYCYYVKYDTTTETFGSVEFVGGANRGTVYATSINCDIAIRSDGDVIAVYGDENSSTNAYDSSSYARREAGTWTSDIELPTGPVNNVDYGAASVVLGASDRAHTAVHGVGNTDIFIHTLTSANVLSAFFKPVLDTDGATCDLGTGHLTLMGSGNIGTAYINVNAYPAWSDWTDADTPVAGTNSVVGTDAVKNLPQGTYTTMPVMGSCKDPDNDDLYVVVAAAADGDLYYYKSTDDNATWGARTSLKASITAEVVECEIYDNGTDWVMGYIYSDGGTNKYDELILRSSGVAAAEAEDEMTLLGCGGGG